MTMDIETLPSGKAWQNEIRIVESMYFRLAFASHWCHCKCLARTHPFFYSCFLDCRHFLHDACLIWWDVFNVFVFFMARNLQLMITFTNLSELLSFLVFFYIFCFNASAPCISRSSPLLWASDQRLEQISPAVSQVISVLTSTSDRHTVVSSEDSRSLDMYRTYHFVRLFAWELKKQMSVILFSCSFWGFFLISW